jgi:DNA-directed RNA polymerase subunit RPC12/RpoP
VQHELARMRGFPCERCGHRHEGVRFSYRCFHCMCHEQPKGPR